MTITVIPTADELHTMSDLMYRVAENWARRMAQLPADIAAEQQAGDAGEERARHHADALQRIWMGH
jgi:hypothetical protein